MVGDFGQPLGDRAYPGRVVGGQVRGHQESPQGFAIVLVGGHQVVERPVMPVMPSRNVAGRVKACNGPHEIGVSGGSGNDHPPAHALAHQRRLLKPQVTDQCGHVVAVTLHRVNLVGLVALAMATQVHCHTSVAR